MNTLQVYLSHHRNTRLFYVSTLNDINKCYSKYCVYVGKNVVLIRL